MLIGYARVSTEDQSLDPQRLALRDAGCEQVIEESASGGDRKRPALAALLKRVRPGDVLVVVRLDRVARSLAHLLQIIETLDASGAAFRSLSDPVDTGSASGRLTLAVLGAVAEFERSLIRERTMAGIDAARARGKQPGNPRLQRMDDTLRREIAAQRRAAYFEKINASAAIWLPIVRKLRPKATWNGVATVVNARSPDGTASWTGEKLRRAAETFVREGLLTPDVLKRTRSTRVDPAMTLVASLLKVDPSMTLAELGQALTGAHYLPPRGGTTWAPSSVKSLRDRARQLGM